MEPQGTPLLAKPGADSVTGRSPIGVAGRFWTAANAVSLVRAALTAPTLLLLWLGPEYRWHTFVVVLVMIATDVADGALARLRRETTEWGKILDPLADKVAIDSISGLLVVAKGLPVWVAASVIGRDVLIVAGGALMATRARSVPPSNVWGKATTCAMAALLVCFAMDFDAPKAALLWAAGLLLAASFLSYVRSFLRQLRTTPSPGGPGCVV
jgi:CDP-diacylglycerol--glycerol-3-phosphate 3-phosphatidyltransferase